MFILHWGAWGARAASLLSMPWTGLSETPEPRVGRLSWEKWPTRAGACKAQAVCLLDLVLLSPGSTLSLSFLMSCDLAQRIRWKSTERTGRGLGGRDRAMLIDPTIQQQVPARVCVGVHPGPHKEWGTEHST